MDRHASRLRGGFSWGFAPLIAPLIAHAKESARWFHFGSTPALPHPAFGRRKMLIRDFESEINTTGCGGELWFLPFCVPRVDLHSDTRYPHGRGHFPCGYAVTQGESTREYAFDPALPLLLPKKMLIRDFRFEINTTGRKDCTPDCGQCGQRRNTADPIRGHHVLQQRYAIPFCGHQ